MKRKTLHRLAAAAVAVACALLAPAAWGAPVFADDFESDPVPASGVVEQLTVLNHWQATRGNVDIVSTLSGHCLPSPGAGHCLDLDGSAGARLVSDTLALAPGSYRLSYDLSGYWNNPSFTTEIVDVYFGGQLLRTVSMPDTTGFTSFFDVFVTADPISGSIVFDQHGADRKGLWLDNVRLDSVPEPASGGFVAAALMALAAVIRLRVRVGSAAPA